MKNFVFWFKFHWSIVPMGPIDNKWTLVQVIAWRRIGGTPSYQNQSWSSSPTHICGTSGGWVKLHIFFRFPLPISHSALRWRHNDYAGVSNHQPHGCLLNRLFKRKSKKTSKLRVTGLCVGNSPGTGEFPAQKASYAENVSIWWRHHGIFCWP